MKITRKIKSSQFLVTGDILASSSVNDYVPFYTVCGNVEISWVNDDIIYALPDMDKYDLVIGNYSNLFNSLLFNLQPDRYEFLFEEKLETIGVMKHFLYDVFGNILAVLTIDSKKIRFLTELYLNMSEDFEYDDFSVFKLFVSTELINNPKYVNVWKKIEKEYVNEFYKKEIKVEFTTSRDIMKQVFSSPYQLEFQDITQLMNHLNNEVPILLRESLKEITEPVQNVEGAVPISSDYTFTSILNTEEAGIISNFDVTTSESYTSLGNIDGTTLSSLNVSVENTVDNLQSAQTVEDPDDPPF